MDHFSNVPAEHLMARQPFAGPPSFETWLRRHGRKGDRVVYHVGLIAADAGSDDRIRSEAEERVAAYREVAARLQREGLVALSQRRLADGVYAYLATRAV